MSLLGYLLNLSILQTKGLVFLSRSGRLSGVNGFMALNRIAPLIVSGFKRRRLAAMIGTIGKTVIALFYSDLKEIL